jgi:inhibitor of KinA
MKRCYLPAGDRMLLVEFSEEISPQINSQVYRLASFLETAAIPGVVESIPSYRSLGIVYNPTETSYERLVKLLDELDELDSQAQVDPRRKIEIPVHYGGESGPDLDFVARHNHLTTEEVIHIHTSNDYLVYLLGFTPGFPYLGGMSPRIATPRMGEPRSRVAAGSVAIGGNQTGIYPIDSPGGWRIIGRTPFRLFDLNREDPFLLKAGDLVRFRSVTPEEYQSAEKRT